MINAFKETWQDWVDEPENKSFLNNALIVTREF
jgi:hypothetical protein